MGHCASREEKEARKRNKKIEDQMRKDQSVTLRTIKLLLLGAGESGKSTILKQMNVVRRCRQHVGPDEVRAFQKDEAPNGHRILHKDGFSQHDFEMIRPVVYSNTVHAMLAVLRAMYQLNIEFADPERQKDAQIVYATVHAQRDAEPFSDSLSQALQRLWADSGVRLCYSRNNEYQIDDSAKYFLDDLPRLSAPEFLPNEQDVLRTRVKTTGITEVLFELKGLTFRVIDVGGQRSERKKWIHCFDNVNAIIFISSLSEYDQTMREDNFTNRMHESLKLFDSICNSPWFVDIHFILFLNKKDLFAEKIRRSPLTVCFPEYKGQQNYSESVNYIQWKFEQLNRNAQREIYCHHTCATDTNNVQFVLDACLDMIIAKNLKSMGLC